MKKLTIRTILVALFVSQFNLSAQNDEVVSNEPIREKTNVRSFEKLKQAIKSKKFVILVDQVTLESGKTELIKHYIKYIYVKDKWLCLQTYPKPLHLADKEGTYYSEIKSYDITEKSGKIRLTINLKSWYETYLVIRLNEKSEVKIDFNSPEYSIYMSGIMETSMMKHLRKEIMNGF